MSIENAVIDFTSLSQEANNIAKQISKKDGTLYKSKPKKDGVSGDCQYIWRHLVFYVSQNRQHQCMPVTASFDLETYDDNGKWCSRLAMKREKELEPIIREILDNIPLHKQSGTIRWLKALS